MSDSAYQVFQRYGTAAERAAFTPVPPTLPAGTQPIYLWYETDTGDLYLYYTSWVLIAGTAVVEEAIDPFLLMGA